MNKIIILLITFITAAGAADKDDYNGVWNTSYGMMRLNVNGSKVNGIYSYTEESAISGEIKGGKFVFKYTESDGARGEGWFKLSEDGTGFKGKWREDGSKRWADWAGSKVKAQKGKRWLIVLEAYWESSLNEKEYSWGDMLKTYFKRFENVEVRHRFFTGSESIKKWIREASFITEPVVLLVSSHGTSKGVTVNSETLNEKTFIDQVKPIQNLKLLHFAACEVMNGGIPGKILKSSTAASFPISGYTTSVDWTQSAVMELLYLSLIFESRMTPEKAAEEIARSYPTSVSKVKGSVYPNAGFKIISPKK